MDRPKEYTLNSAVVEHDPAASPNAELGSAGHNPANRLCDSAGVLAHLLQEYTYEV